MEKKENKNNNGQLEIDINNIDQLRDWSDVFGVTKVRLKAAINTVGPMVKNVEAYLNKRNS